MRKTIGPPAIRTWLVSHVGIITSSYGSLLYDVITVTLRISYGFSTKYNGRNTHCIIVAITLMILSFQHPNFSDRYAWANSAVWSGSTLCHSVCIVWTHYSMVEPQSSILERLQQFLGCPTIQEIYSTQSIPTWYCNQYTSLRNRDLIVE